MCKRAVPCKTAGRRELSEVGLRNLGLACLNEGDIDYTQFRLSEASEQYETACRLSPNWCAATTTAASGSRRSVVQVGGVAEDQLDLDRALDSDATIAEDARAVAARGSNDEKLLRDRAEGYEYVGDIREKQGYLSDALVNFDKAIALSRAKDSTEWLYIQQDGLIGESEILARQGDSARSEQSAKRAYDCATNAAAKSPFAPEGEVPARSGALQAACIRESEARGTVEDLPGSRRRRGERGDLGPGEQRMGARSGTQPFSAGRSSWPTSSGTRLRITTRWQFPW